MTNGRECFDLPGFGESRNWDRDPTSDAHIAIMEHYMKRGDIDAEHISFVGISYGGGASLIFVRHERA